MIPLLLALTAHAQDLTLVDVDGHAWGFESTHMTLVAGDAGAFDAVGQLWLDAEQVEGTFPRTRPDGETYETGTTFTAYPSGVFVRRAIRVETGRFGDVAHARFVEFVLNNTRDRKDVTVRVEHDLGGSPVLVGDDTGDGAFSTADRWLVTDDGPGGVPALAFGWGDGTGPPDRVRLAGDRLTAEWDLSLFTGEGAYVVHHLAQRDTVADALDVAARFAAPDDALTIGLRPIETTRTVNQDVVPRPRLSIEGACPGVLDVLAVGLDLDDFAVVQGRPGRSFTVPEGPCAGTDLDVGAPTLVGQFPRRSAGVVRELADIPAAWCGTALQILDLGTCAVTGARRF